MQHQVPLCKTYSQLNNGDQARPPYYKFTNNVSGQFALRLPKYISVKLQHDSSGLPYIKDRLLSCAARTLEIISKNLSVEESITFDRVNPAWESFQSPLSVIHPVSLCINMTYRGNFSKHLIALETGSPADMRTRLAQSSDLKL